MTCFLPGFPDGLMANCVVASLQMFVWGGVSGERLYFIQYLDSDVEHLTEQEVREGFVLWATQGSEMDASADPSAKESLSVNDEAIESLSPDEMDPRSCRCCCVNKSLVDFGKGYVFFNVQYLYLSY